MTKTDQDRVDFEAWTDAQCSDETRGLWMLRRGTSYAHPVTRGAWEAWQAALAHERARAQGEPVAWAEFASNGNVRFWTADHARSAREHLHGRNLTPLYAANLPAPAQPVAVPAKELYPAHPGADKAWQDLCEKDDRTSIDYPGFALIRQDELATYMLAAAPVAPPAESEPVAVPAGWKLVPEKVTPQMADAWGNVLVEEVEGLTDFEQDTHIAQANWSAMLAAAPTAPVVAHETPPVSNNPACVSSAGDNATPGELANDFRVVSSSAPPAESGEVERLRGALQEFPANDFATDTDYLREIDKWWIKVARPALSHTPAPPPEPAKAEVVDDVARVEAIAQWLHDEGGFDDAWNYCTWPEHPDDDGRREGGFVKIVPSNVQAKFRDTARRLIGHPALATPPAAPAAARSAAEEDKK